MKSSGYDNSERSDSNEAEGPIDVKAIGTRIERIAEGLGGKRNLANAIGVHETQLYRYIKGTNAPSVIVAASIAKAGRVSLDWLITGESSTQDGGVRERAVQVEADEYAYIPLYDACCSAGHGAWSDGCRVLANLAFTRYSLRKKGLEPAQLSAIRVDGDSMEGLLKDGDTVLLDHRRNALEGEAVYVIRLDDHLYAKRLQRQFDGAVHIISQNREYQTMVVPKERLGELVIVGRVVWAASWLI